MERRGFFGAFAGLIAYAAGARAVEPAKPEAKPQEFKAVTGLKFENNTLIQTVTMFKIVSGELVPGASVEAAVLEYVECDPLA